MVQNNPRPGQDRSYMGHLLPLKDIKITRALSQRNKKPRLGQNLNKKPRPGQNLVLKIDWTGTYFGLGQILAQNNPKLGKIKYSE